MDKKVRFDFLNNWKKFLSSKEFNRLTNEYVVEQGIKALVARGDSPVKNHGRFKGYSVERNPGDPKHLYPNSVRAQYPDKLRRPVNLFLSGDYLSKLKAKNINKGVEIGFFSLSPNQRDMFEAHNNGANKNIPMRKHIPTEEGEELKEVIMQTFTRGLLRALKKNKITD